MAQKPGVVRVVRTAQNRLLNVGQIDLDHGGVLGVCIGCQQLGLGEPGLYFFDATQQGALVFVAVGDHVFHQHDVAGEVFLDRRRVELDGATGGGTFGRRVGQLKRLLDFQIGQAFDFQDATREHVDLADLGHRQQTGLDRVQRNGMHQVAQGHAGLHFTFEAHQHRLGHVQRHHAGGGAKRHQTGASGEADADGETGV